MVLETIRRHLLEGAFPASHMQSQRVGYSQILELLKRCGCNWGKKDIVFTTIGRKFFCQILKKDFFAID